METIGMICTGWLLIMDIYTGRPTSKTDTQISTIAVCVPSEIACRRAGAEREVTLRNEFGFFPKQYAFTCTDMSKK